MEEKRVPVVIYQVPLLPELEVKTLIIESLPSLKLALEHISLRNKDGKFQAFIMAPASKVDGLCSQRDVTIGNEKVYVKKSFIDAQIFIGRLAENVTIGDIRTSFEADFGKILNINEGQPHEGAKQKLRHCFVQFERDEDAQKCLFNPKKVLVKGIEIRPIRSYGFGQNEETDKKLFLKIQNNVDDIEELQRTLNQYFQKEGKLREKIRVENNKAIVTYTSNEVADKVVKLYKGNKIGKYEVVVRPYANNSNFSIFLKGLNPHTTSRDLEVVFAQYQPLLSCTVSSTYNSSTLNGTITFDKQESFKQVLAEYRQLPRIQQIFIGLPYITRHMNIKDRNQYNSFRKGKNEPKKILMNQPIIPPPMNFSLYQMQQMQPMQKMPQSMQPMPQMQPLGMMLNRPMMPNFGMPGQYPHPQMHQMP